MATIRLYTTSLEHQHTQDIAWRGTKYAVDPFSTCAPVTTVRVERIDQSAGDITIAQIVEDCGDTKAYAVRTILTRRYAQDADTGQPVAEPAQVTEYELTPLSDDAARIVEAVLQRRSPFAIDYQFGGDSEAWSNPNSTTVQRAFTR